MSCIDEEVLGAFVEGTLDAPRRREVMEHLDACEACTAAAGLAAAALREESPAIAPRASHTTWWLAAAAVLATALLAIAAFRGRWFVTSPMETLVAAAPADRRAIEPRLTGGFPWAEYRGPAREAARSPLDPPRLKLHGAAGAVLDRSAKDPSAESSHAAGLALLLIEDAGASIDKLRTIAGNDPKVWSDLAAAYFATGRPSHLPEALAAADRALALDPQLVEARFNRALILERMGLAGEARKAWQRYLESDSSSAWATEARAHLARLEAPRSSFERDLPRLSAQELVARYPQEARTWSEGPFLAEWAERGDTAKLALARAIGDALVQRSQETLLRDAVAAIDRATDRRSLIEGHLRYRQGRIAYSRRELGAAHSALLRAADAFARGGSPMALAARYFAANAVYDMNRPEEALAQLSALLAATPSTHRALRAQILWQRALCASTLAHWSESIADAEEARAIFESLGEESNRAFVDTIVAHALAFGEERDRAWERRIGAFDVLSRLGAGERLVAALGAAVQSEVQQGNLDAARSLAGIEIEAARSVPNRGLFAVALLYRALLLHRSGAGDPSADIAEARAIAPQTGDRARLEAEIDFAEGVIARRSDPRHAVALLTRTAEFARASFPSYVPGTLLERGRAYHQLGDLDRAWSDLTDGIEYLEARRDPRAMSEMETGSLFDDEQNLYAAAVGVATARDDAATALAYADRALQHALRSRFPSARRGMRIEPPAPDQALLEIYLAGDRVRLFCVTANGIETVAGGDAEQVRRDARALASRNRAHEFQPLAASLYQSLVAPVRTSLASARSLVIVADPRLGFIPFAALFDAQRRRYLIEDFEIVCRPASMLALAPRTSLSREARALVVAEPEHAGVAPLPGAAREAREVAARYRAANVLSGAGATPAAVVRALETHRIVHYAGHADAEEQRAGALLLTGGRLHASDIARLDLQALDLIVLAACRSSRAVHDAVPRDLATAFLVAGARNVVGTGWEIEDETSVAMFTELHRSVASGTRVASALRDVQLAAIQASQSPSAWGALTLLSIERS